MFFKEVLRKLEASRLVIRDIRKRQLEFLVHILGKATLRAYILLDLLIEKQLGQATFIKFLDIV